MLAKEDGRFHSSQEEKLKELKEVEKMLKYTLKTEFYPGFETKEWVDKESKKHTIKAKIDRDKANRKPMSLRKKHAKRSKHQKLKKQAKTACGVALKIVRSNKSTNGAWAFCRRKLSVSVTLELCFSVLRVQNERY